MNKPRGSQRKITVKPRGDRISHAWAAEETSSLPKYAPKGSKLEEIVSLLQLCAGAQFDDAWRQVLARELDGISREFNFRRARSDSLLLNDVIGNLDKLERECKSLSKTIRDLDEITLSYIVGSQSPRRPTTIPTLPDFNRLFEEVFWIPTSEQNTPPLQDRSVREFMRRRGPLKRVESLGRLAHFLQRALRGLHGQDLGGNSTSRDVGSEWTGHPLERVIDHDKSPHDGQMPRRDLIRGFKDFLAFEAGQLLLSNSPGHSGVRFITATDPSKSDNSISGAYRKLINFLFEHATGLSPDDVSDGTFEVQAKFFVKYFRDWVDHAQDSPDGH